MTNQLCQIYGHQWKRDAQESATLPPGYVKETCKWCGKSQVKMMR